MWKKQGSVEHLYCKEDGVAYCVNSKADLYHKKDGVHRCSKESDCVHYYAKKNAVSVVQLVWMKG